MSDARTTTIQIGPSGMTVLTIVFVLLKVFGKIDWSWLWVFSPLWIPIAIMLIFLLSVVIIFGVVALMEK